MAWADRQARDYSVVGCGDGVLHLHRLDGQQRLPGLDLLPVGHTDALHRSRHRGAYDAVAGPCTGPRVCRGGGLLVHGPRAALAAEPERAVFGERVVVADGASVVGEGEGVA